MKGMNFTLQSRIHGIRLYMRWQVEQLYLKNCVRNDILYKYQSSKLKIVQN